MIKNIVFILSLICASSAFADTMIWRETGDSTDDCPSYSPENYENSTGNSITIPHPNRQSNNYQHHNPTPNFPNNPPGFIGGTIDAYESNSYQHEDLPPVYNGSDDY